MKFGTIGAGGRACVRAGSPGGWPRSGVEQPTWPRLLAGKIAGSRTARRPPRSRRRPASTMSCSPFPGRMSRTRCGACRLERPSTHRRDKSVQRVQPSARAGRPGGQGASEVVAALAPGARVVKAFNSIVIARFNEGPAKDGGRRVIFVSGDHPEPVEFVKGLIESFGFAPITSAVSRSAAGCSRRAARSPAAILSISATTESMEEIADAWSDDQGLWRTDGSARAC